MRLNASSPMPGTDPRRLRISASSVGQSMLRIMNVECFIVWILVFCGFKKTQGYFFALHERYRQIIRLHKHGSGPAQIA